MISRVPPSAPSRLHPAVRLPGPARLLIGVGERGTAGAAAPGRHPAPHQAPAPPGRGRPRHPGRADPAPAQKASGAPAGHARHCSPVAPAAWPERSGPTSTGWAGHRSAPRSPRSSSGSPPRTPHGETSGSRANCSNSATGPAPDGFRLEKSGSRLLTPPGSTWRHLFFPPGKGSETRMAQARASLSTRRHVLPPEFRPSDTFSGTGRVRSGWISALLVR
jgi:hypothetical protein